MCIPRSAAKGRLEAREFMGALMVTGGLKGKAVAVNLIYTQCDVNCPLETAKMRQVQRLLGDRVGKDIFFYSISIDPVHDTPAALKAYAQSYHAGPGWLFLTGKEEDIKLIAKKLGLSSVTDGSNRDRHLPSLMVGDEPRGQWMRNSALDNPRFLATTIGNFLGWRSAEPAKSYADIRKPPKVERGAYLFQTRCAPCHSVGKGNGIGPDLVNVTARRKRTWVTRFVAEPDRMLEEGDPIAVQLRGRYKNVRMPNLGLSAEEVAVLLAYIETQSRNVAPRIPASSFSRPKAPPATRSEKAALR